MGFSVSNATVRVFGESGIVYEASAPPVDTGYYWHVFDFDGSTLQVTPVNAVETSVPTLPSCADGLSYCNDACTDTSYDGENCGMCGVICGSSEICVQGMCTLG